MLEFLKFTTISETEINIKAVDITLLAPSYFKETTFCDSRVLRPLCHFMEVKLRELVVVRLDVQITINQRRFLVFLAFF